MSLSGFTRSSHQSWFHIGTLQMAQAAKKSQNTFWSSWCRRATCTPFALACQQKSRDSAGRRGMLPGPIDETDRHPRPRPTGALSCSARACRDKKLLLFGCLRVSIFGTNLQFLFGSTRLTRTYQYTVRFHTFACTRMYACTYVCMQECMDGQIN